MNIAELAIEKRVITWVMTAIIVVLGIRSYDTMGRLEDPEYTIKEALVITHYPGASARQVEQEVTDKIETKIQEMSELKRIYSINKPGVSIITAEMKNQYDRDALPLIWQKLRSKVGDVQPTLPPGTLPSIVNDDFGDVYGILLALTGDGYTYAELKEFAKLLRKELLLVKDVAKIIIQGDQEEVIYVELDRARMSQLDIGLDQVFTSLQEKNKLIDAGHLRVGDDFIRINPTGAVNAVADIENLVIAGQNLDSENKNLIYLKDIADIKREYRDPFDNKMHFNGAPAIALAVSTALGGNVVEMGEALTEKLYELKSRIPIGLEIHPISVQSARVTDSINNFIVNLAEAVAIVFVVLMVFMGFRSGAIIGVALVLTVLATFILMKMHGVLLERISLGALVIALGMLVDNAIVVIDGMLVRIQQGMERIKAAREVVSQNMVPLLGATVIAIFAFAAIGLSQDSTGEYTRSLFFVILYSLLLSWLIAITIVPLIGVMLIKVDTAQGENKDIYDNVVYRKLRQFLTFCIRFRFATVAVLVVMLFGSMFLFTNLKQSFFPNSERDQFMIDFYLPKGTDIRVVEDYASQLEKDLLDDERVRDVSVFIGQPAPRFLLTYQPEKDPSSYAFFLVGVKDSKAIEQMLRDYYQHIHDHYPQVNPRIHKFKLGPGKPPVEPTFYGPDPEVLRALGEKASRILEDAHAVAIRTQWGERVLEVKPRFDEDRANKVGVSREDLAVTLDMNFIGVQAGIYREDDELLPIMARASEQDRAGVDEVENTQVWSSGLRTYVPIGQVTEGYDLKWVDESSNRKNRKLWFKVMADPEPGMMNSVLFSAVKNKIESIELPHGYEFEWEGEYLSQTEAQDGLMRGIPIFFGLMVLIVIFLFNSIRKTLVIWLTVPLALIGVSVGLFIFEQPFDFMATLGFLSLSGMLIKNSIVLLDEMNLEVSKGTPPYEAILHSVQVRARPVAMAALTTVLGMIPLLQDAFFVAMAVTIMAGLTFATVLSLVIVPVLYAIFFKVKEPTPQHATG